MISSSKKINSEEFTLFLNKGVKKTSKFFNISYLKEKSKKQSKYAVILNKKNVKTAVLRKKNKRIIFKIISQIYPQFLDHKYIFIFIKKDISNINKGELMSDLIHILNK